MKILTVGFSLFTFLVSLACCQELSLPSFNLDFEKVSSKNPLPDDWFVWGSGYLVQTDSLINYQGKYTVRIQSQQANPEHPFGSVVYKIPATHQGKEIELRGFMKMKEVQGTAGLLMRIDGEQNALQFNNMLDQGLKGSSDWKAYSIKLPLPAEAKTIYVGAILSGAGTIWIDDFQLFIDGQALSKAPSKQLKTYPADADTTFSSRSGIDSIPTTPQTIKSLQTLGLLWGFLKYYHPAVAEGNYNWDKELFRILPQVLRANSPETLNKLYIAWIKKLGPIKPANAAQPIPGHLIKLSPDLAWINHSSFSLELVSLLEQVKGSKKPKEHFYIAMAPVVGNPEFRHENAYEYMKYPDAGYRLLALYRYWKSRGQYWRPEKR